MTRYGIGVNYVLSPHIRHDKLRHFHAYHRRTSQLQAKVQLVFVAHGADRGYHVHGSHVLSSVDGNNRLSNHLPRDGRLHLAPVTHETTKPRNPNPIRVRVRVRVRKPRSPSPNPVPYSKPDPDCSAPDTDWGRIGQSLIFHQVRKYLLQLDPAGDHVKFWRAQMLYLCSSPHGRCNVLEFLNNLKKGGLFIVGDVVFTGTANHD